MIRHKSKILNGLCLCGAIRYEVVDAFNYAMNCHCSQCRRVTGSAFKAFGGIEIEKFQITNGADQLVRYGDEVGYDAHCGKCGFLVYSLVREGTYAHVTYGTLVDNPSLLPTEHIFVGSKAAWFTITDDLPQHPEFPS